MAQRPETIIMDRMVGMAAGKLKAGETIDVAVRSAVDNFKSELCHAVRVQLAYHSAKKRRKHAKQSQFYFMPMRRV